MIQENADPDVQRDLLAALAHAAPDALPGGAYRHDEGNSPAHVKSSLVGCSVTVLVDGGELVLGTWQGIYLCEFDGPRTRRVLVRMLRGRWQPVNSAPLRRANALATMVATRSFF